MKKIEEQGKQETVVQQIPQVKEIATNLPVVNAPENTVGRTFFSVQELFRPEEVDNS